MKTTLFGSWKSPITSDLIVAGTIGLGAVTIDGDNIYWLEARPTEKGRNVLVKCTADGKITDVTPPPFNVRTRVHEYGGGAFLVENGTVFFTNFSDQRIYQQKLDETPQPLTPESQRRYADMCLDKYRNRLICVCEDHSQTNHEPENTLVSINLNSGEVEVLVSGADFYCSPRISPDGKQLTWYSWNHPNLPWDGTELWVAKINLDGSLSDAELIAGGKNESICEPKWSPDGMLYFSSDKTGWWNLYCRNFEGEIEALSPMDAEFGYPHWVFGESIYDFVNDKEIICTYGKNGSWYLASLNTESKEIKKINTPYTSISYLQVRENKIVFIGGSPTQPTGVVNLDLNTEDKPHPNPPLSKGRESVFPPLTKGGSGGVNPSKIQVLKQSSNLEIDSGYLSTPEAIAFPTENGLIAYGWYYPPKNKDYTAPAGNLPPLLVKSHGGPTAAASATFNLRIQYWTSRGFAFLDVNYGGSTGYGREYRERLNGKWGIVDVDDCVNGAKYLVNAGKVDGEKLAISGGSAGGYTTLAALTFRDTFKAGASYYGVSDLEALAKDTHKFEARYLDNLIGKYPEEKEIYERRSPINFTEKLSCPVIFFQGLEDKVVPPNQAETMVAALKNKGITVDYVAFEGEQHGFRQAENIKKALDEEFQFYARVFGF
ncbi:MAG: S9 family peptidase [Gomphosphaeria aponina SAG 52.96 = DSM 107014]|uniref:S9 family peptidase n=1 Tax=Gomphosphaeria aponina SAG 52.96 = DSM 107014 TaxID=1521640 RepID=A0A941GSM3_9CHRO|nr:S9 family peptidase [Gomphosphaeria aponina SAG 52.96 = DSM 107014]